MVILLIVVAALGIGVAANFLIQTLIERHRNRPRSPSVYEAVYEPQYSIREQYVTDCELAYFKVLYELIAPLGYLIFPQVPLSQIIKKNSEFQGELNRVIDFCIFDSRYRPLLCIEINDRSHYKIERRERDEKVQTILDSAGLPLVTFWTKYGVNENYIRQRLSEHLSIA